MAPMSSLVLPPLLHVAEQLGEVWWRESVMELLWDETGALASTALSCKQLRSLCHHGAHKLRLPPEVLQDAATMTCIPSCFPALCNLEVQLQKSEDLGTHLPAALQALTG
jgi:hypothetical protein